MLPKREDGSTGAYTSVGLAEALFDSLDEARSQVAYASGLGCLLSHLRPVRLASMSTRQATFLRHFGNVERWLRTGTYQV